MGRYLCITSMQFSIFNFPSFAKASAGEQFFRQRRTGLWRANQCDTRYNNESGFSLVEMVVAVGLFSIVMVVSVATLFALVNAHRKAQALQSVINNLNISLDGMARALRMGSHYHCGSTGTISEPRDCAAGDVFLAFEPYGGAANDLTDQWVYKYEGSQLLKSENGGASGTFFPLTAPEIVIEDLKFYVRGSVGGCDDIGGGDCVPIQPSVVAVVTGTAESTNTKARSSFHIQVAATQRLLGI